MTKTITGGSLRPSTVVRAFSPLVGGPVKVREIIAVALQEGSLQARAAHRWIDAEKDLARAWKKEPQKDDYPKLTKFEKHHAIRPSDWRKSISMSDDLLMWDFRNSRFHITVSCNPTSRIMLRDVRFLITDVRSTFSFTSSNDDLKFTRANKINDWRRFWHEVILLAAAGSTNLKSSLLAESKNDASIVETVLERITGEEEISSALAASDDEVATYVSEKLRFNLSRDSIMQEVKLLRQSLGLKAKYTSQGKKLGLLTLSKPGSRGRAG